jgi:hypothetical protein
VSVEAANILVLTKGHESKETCHVYKSSFLLRALPSNMMLSREENLQILHSYVRKNK